jgi:hypothetical protein
MSGPVRRAAGALLAAGALASLAPLSRAAAQLPNQSFSVTPETAHATVGDPVTLRFRVRLDQFDLLYDTLPRPVGGLSDAVRVLSVEKLHREPDRSFAGEARVAFYRTGRQAVPIFGLPFMRGVKGMTRAMLTSDSAFVEIDPVAPPGEPRMKDIHDIVRPRTVVLRAIAAALLAAIGIAGWLAIRRRRRGSAPATHEPEPPPPMPDPYDVALRRLAEIEAARWPAQGDVERHYAAVADTVRRYLEESRGLSALARTTAELTAALPFADGDLRARTAQLLQGADLVKFARERPGQPEAEVFLAEARGLLADWR